MSRAVNQLIQTEATAPVEVPLGYSVELRKADELVPYARNARTHSDQQILELMGMIREFGWTNPILVDDVIRAGHGRQRAALKLYAAGETISLPNGKTLPSGYVPVIDCTGWSDAQKKAYVIADNRSTEHGGWDQELLKLEIGDLQTLDFNLDHVGFSGNDLKSLFEIKPAADTGPQLGGDLTHQVIVVCRDEDQQRDLLARFETEGLECRALIS